MKLVQVTTTKVQKIVQSKQCAAAILLRGKRSTYVAGRKWRILKRGHGRERIVVIQRRIAPIDPCLMQMFLAKRNKNTRHPTTIDSHY